MAVILKISRDFYNKSIRQLQLVQDAAASVVTRSEILLLVHKSPNLSGQSYLSDVLTQYEPCRRLGSGGSGLQAVPRVKIGTNYHKSQTTDNVYLF